MKQKGFQIDYQSRCIIWYQLVSRQAVVFRLAAFVVYLDAVLGTTGAQGHTWGCWLGGYCKSRYRFENIGLLHNSYFVGIFKTSGGRLMVLGFFFLHNKQLPAQHPYM